MPKPKSDYFTRVLSIMDVVIENPEIVRNDLIKEVRKKLCEHPRVIRKTVREMLEDNFITEVEIFNGRGTNNAPDRRRARGLIIKSRRRYEAFRKANSPLV